MRTGLITYEWWRGLPQGSIGSSRLRGTNWCKACPWIEPYVLGKEYDLIILQKADWVDFAQHTKATIIYDQCDWQWSDATIRTMQAAKGIIFSSSQLLQAYEGYIFKSKVVIDDAIVQEDVRECKTYNPHCETPIRTIFWFGYSSNASILAPWIDLLADLGIQLVVCTENPAFSERYPDVQSIKYTTYEDCIDRMLGCDAVLMPDYDHPFTKMVEDGTNYFKYKTRNKTYLAQAHGMITITKPEDFKLSPKDLVIHATTNQRIILKGRSNQYIQEQLMAFVSKLGFVP